MRRAVLGEEHVDRAEADTTAFTAPFQVLATRYARGEIRTRPGPGRRTRSRMVPMALLAHGHGEEPDTHVRVARRSEPRDEIGEVFPRGTVYRGVPAANKAFGIAQKVFVEEE